MTEEQRRHATQIRAFAPEGKPVGALGPAALELRLGSDVELLAVTQDGTFAFETRLETGASYTVVFADPTTPCTLRSQTGRIADANASIERMCASLASVVVSGIAPAVTLVPATTEYVVGFGVSVALSSDTLAVGASGEDSAAQGVGGNQDDNSGTDSGAVYIFH